MSKICRENRTHYSLFQTFAVHECLNESFGYSSGGGAFSADVSELTIPSIFIGVKRRSDRIGVEGYKYRICLAQSWLEPFSYPIIGSCQL